MVGGPHRILVVDEVSESRDAIRDALRAPERMVYLIDNAVEALDALAEEAAKGHPMDLVLASTSLQGLSGRELLVRMRQGNYSQPFVALASHDEKGLDEKARMKLEAEVARDYMLMHDASSFCFKNDLGGLPRTVAKLLRMSAIRETRLPKENLQVLVADDDPHAREMFKIMLQEHGYQVVTAANGEETWQHLRTTPVGMLLIDKCFGKDDGLTIANSVANLYPYVSRVMITGSPSADDIAVLGKRLIDYLSKPVSQEDLMATVHKAFSARENLVTHLLESGTPRIWGIAGPQATGKTTTVDGVVRALPCTYKFIRHTTRPPRPYELQGNDHHFVSESYLDEHARDFISIQPFRGYRVGFEKGAIEDQRQAGMDVLITFTAYESVVKMKELYPEMKTICILSNPEEMVARSNLRGGQKISYEEAKRQFDTYMKNIDTFDHHLLNIGPEIMSEYRIEAARAWIELERIRPDSMLQRQA